MKILFTDFSTKLQTINDLQTRARGGMISSLFLIPDALSKLNNQVSVWSDVENGGITPSGVRWATVEDYDAIVAHSWDFLVFNRGMGNGLPEIKAKHRILWTHDLVHGGHAPYPNLLKSLSATVFMSRYAERIWRIYYPQIGRSFLIPNGVDKNLFYPREKDLSYLIYISAPNRGLHRLGIIFKSIKTKINRELKFRAYSNMSILHPGDREAKDDIKHEDGGEGWGTKYDPQEMNEVEILDPLPQIQISEELGRAGLMILPTGFPEICSNAILQSLASGTPIVTTGNLGSVSEWIKDGWNGALTKTHLEDYAVHLMEIMRLTIKVLSDEKLHLNMIHHAPKTKGLLSWEKIGLLWNTMLHRI